MNNETQAATTSSHDINVVHRHELVWGEAWPADELPSTLESLSVTLTDWKGLAAAYNPIGVDNGRQVKRSCCLAFMPAVVMGLIILVLAVTTEEDTEETERRFLVLGVAFFVALIGGGFYQGYAERRLVIQPLETMVNRFNETDWNHLPVRLELYRHVRGRSGSTHYLNFLAPNTAETTTTQLPEQALEAGTKQ